MVVVEDAESPHVNLVERKTRSGERGIATTRVRAVWFMQKKR